MLLSVQLNSNQLIDFFVKLLSTSDWPARWNCGEWSLFHGWVYVISDMMIWLAYFIIPIIIFWFVHKQPKMPFLPIFAYFGAFIVFCGITHFLDALIFWWPAYRLEALFKFITACVSLLTVCALIRDLPKLLKLNLSKSTEVLSKELEEQKIQLIAKDNKIKDLLSEIERLNSRLE